MPHYTSNIPKNIFYSSIFSEILRIARCTLLFSDFTPRVRELCERMKNQGADPIMFSKQMSKAIERYPQNFMKFEKSKELIISTIFTDDI